MTFGLQNEKGCNELDDVLSEVPATYPVLAERITLAAYQTDMGIFDHRYQQRHRPLALVAFHDKEDALEGSSLYTLIRKFDSHDIAKRFGLSLTEFLEYPPHLVDLMLGIASGHMESERRKQNSVHQQLEGLHQGLSNHSG